MESYYSTRFDLFLRTPKMPFFLNNVNDSQFNKLIYNFLFKILYIFSNSKKTFFGQNKNYFITCIGCISYLNLMSLLAIFFYIK